MRAPPVSVVMSIGHAPPNLEWGLDQLLHVLRFDDELIVLDHSGLEQVQTTVQRIQGRHGPVRVVQTAPNGSKPLLFGAEQAINPVVLFLNESHHMPTPSWHAFLVELQHNAQQADCLWGCFALKVPAGQWGLAMRVRGWWLWSRLTKRVHAQQAVFVSRALLIQHANALVVHPCRSYAMLSSRLWFNPSARFVAVPQAVIFSPKSGGRLCA